MTNEDRAWSVEQQVIAFADYAGLDLDPDADGPVTGAGDMICAILHWVAQTQGVGPAMEAARNAVSAFLVEQAAGPAATAADGVCNVNLTARGWGGDLDSGSPKGRDDFTVYVDNDNVTMVGLVASRTAHTVLHGAK